MNRYSEFIGNKSKTLTRDGYTQIRDLSQINAHTTPKQISEFVGTEMKKFINEQIHSGKEMRAVKK